MTVRRSSPLAVALMCGALLAGCGSSGSSTTSSTPAASTPTTSSTAAASKPATAATTPTVSTATPTAPSATGLSSAAVAQYVAICKSIVDREPTLAANVKSKVEGICNKAAHGDLAAARSAAKEVCVEVINASPIPSVAKEKALAACKAS
jgi:hypothetical protein